MNEGRVPRHECEALAKPPTSGLMAHPFIKKCFLLPAERRTTARLHFGHNLQVPPSAGLPGESRCAAGGGYTADKEWDIQCAAVMRNGTGQEGPIQVRTRTPSPTVSERCRRVGFRIILTHGVRIGSIN